MDDSWLEIEGEGKSERFRLKRGLTTVGGANGDVPLSSTGSGTLHVWDEPPKVIFVGGGLPPLLRGKVVEESELRSGDVLEWCGLRLTFRGGAREAPLEELAEAQIAPAATAAPARPSAGSAPAAPAPAAREVGAGIEDSAERRAWRRLKAGMLVELGLADKKAARRWQEAVLRGEFEADAAARELLGQTTSTVGDDRLVERSARLMRDLLMAPTTKGLRGAGRRARGAARNGLAFVLSQFLVIGVYSILVGVALFVVRLKWDWSIDGFLDGIRGLFGS